MTTPQPDDDYTWPTCTACGHDLWQTETHRRTCRPCEDRTRTRLTELPDLFNQLNQTATLMRGTSPSSSPTSGTKAPPIPPRLEVLTLTAPGGAHRTLQDIEDAWRTALDWQHQPRTDATSVNTFAPWRADPTVDVPRHATVLLNNLPWACEQYDSIGQDIEEIRRLHRAITAALTNERRPGRIPIGFCPTLTGDDGQPCGADLTASTASNRIHCPTCDTRWDTIDDWKRLRADQQTILATLETAA